MNNGCQKSNGFEKTKEGGKIFNTFFYPNVKSKHVRPLATNIRIHESLNNTYEEALESNKIDLEAYTLGVEDGVKLAKNHKNI